jgi:hypothetical protein
MSRVVAATSLATFVLGSVPASAQSSSSRAMSPAAASIPKDVMLVDWERQKKNVLAYLDTVKP